ncbi:MAG TPA: hypothetical protein VGA56_13420 [Opitutaceae bacterium]
MKFSLGKNSLLVASLLYAGCHPLSTDVPELTDTVIVGPEFSANKGLFVPEDTRRSLGLKVVEIGEQRISSSLELSLRVYGIAGDTARASGLVGSEQAKVLKVGQPLRVRTSDGRPIVGTIIALDAEMQKTTGLVEVLAEAPKTTETALGSFISADAEWDSSETVATVPRSALVLATDGYFVYTVSGKHFVRTMVTIGARNADVAEIKEGLYAGDEVVSEPVMALWLTELAAVKGGHACCVVPAKGK